MPRHEFSAKTKAQAALRAGGKCETCGAKLRVGYIEYDHDIPDAINGSNSVENCRVLCRSCHGGKTKKDRKTIAKAYRNFRTANGIRKPRTFTRWRKFNGDVVIATRNR